MASCTCGKVSTTRYISAVPIRTPFEFSVASLLPNKVNPPVADFDAKSPCVQTPGKPSK